jgi:hypothetical protein
MVTIYSQSSTTIMFLSGEIGGFLSILYLIISFIAHPFISYLSQLEAIE